MWRSAWSVVGGVIGGECCERFGGRVVMAVVTGWDVYEDLE